MRKDRLLIIGTIPPPVGGVSIHVHRLIESLACTNIKYTFSDLRKTPILTTISSIFKNKVIHLHTSNVYFTFCFSMWCVITRKALIITYHGNVDRYGYFKNLLDHISLRLASIPIVINQPSFEIVSKLNPNTQLLPAFIPPLKVNELDEIIVSQIDKLKEKFKYVFSTNAFNVSYDKYGKEIYQITDIVKLFNSINDIAIVISDPSSGYYQYFKSIGLNLNGNILLLPFIHDFNAIIIQTDCLIRFTTTDGDSLSVKEALYSNSSVIATDVVNRPEGVILIKNNIESLKNAIEFYKPTINSNFNENGFEGILKIYKSVLSPSQ